MHCHVNRVDFVRDQRLNGHDYVRDLRLGYHASTLRFWDDCRFKAIQPHADIAERRAQFSHPVGIALFCLFKPVAQTNHAVFHRRHRSGAVADGCFVPFDNVRECFLENIEAPVRSHGGSGAMRCIGRRFAHHLLERRRQR